jgi:hypothetical protein
MTELQKALSHSPEMLANKFTLDKSDSNSLSISADSLLNNSSKSKRKNHQQNSKNGSISLTPKTTEEIEEEYDGLIHVDESNASSTLKKLNVLRKNRQLCDLILQLDEDSEDIFCHQIILACNSKFFMEIFNSYELEQANNQKQKCSTEDLNNNNSNNNADDAKKQHSNGRLGSTESVSSLNANKKTTSSFLTIVNTNLNSTHRQLLFCLSDYLRLFLSDSYHHHYAKLNSIINHNSNHQHHHNQLYLTQTENHDQEEMHRINANLDYEALKICIDFMYKSELKVPSYLLPHVYTLAYHLSFEAIVQACALHLTKHLSVDNCLSIRSFALDENLIETSSNCIEKNIEYILQVKSNFKSSTTSLNSSNGKNNLNEN